LLPVTDFADEGVQDGDAFTARRDGEIDQASVSSTVAPLAYAVCSVIVLRSEVSCTLEHVGDRK
jgi:hypothetical protein